MRPPRSCYYTNLTSLITYNFLSPVAFAFEYYVDSYLPEVVEIGFEYAMALAAVQIPHLGTLYIVETTWHIGIVWREKTGLELNAELLQLSAVEIKILTTQWAHSYQFDVATEHVEYHRYLIKRPAAKGLTQACDAKIVGKLAAASQMMVIVHPLLQKLGIGSHRTKLIHLDNTTVVSDSRQCDDTSIVALSAAIDRIRHTMSRERDSI